ncbi:FlgO family outer membrane protein [Desulfobacula phenolica]|uniref:FlgO domain-containing protein n=1 Tax=Desulfobacula phenolica TaxID=90732 RepID=A0A1H2IDD2_9BACT|nr:FlgO family outer membrane protein [Desulfobacula phenolica]SDU42147.1 hypothetical protein SAMN04487931_108102 [Desulfobacula phenolica]
MKSLSIFIISLFFLISFFSCRHIEPSPESLATEKNSDIRTQNIEAVDELLNNCNNQLSLKRPIIVASLVSVDDIYKSSTYGRMSAEIIANRLAQHGYSVKELKMNQNRIYIKKGEGEFVLSRDLQNVASKHDVQAVVVGTYALLNEGYKDSVCVCLKIVDPISNIIGCSKCYIFETRHENWE